MSACVTEWFDPPLVDEGAEVPIAATIATMMTVAATVLMGALKFPDSSSTSTSVLCACQLQPAAQYAPTAHPVK
jgi:hypothetical protein